MKASFSIKEITPALLSVFIDIIGFGLVFPVVISMLTNNEGGIITPETSETVRYAYLALIFMLYPFFMFFGTSFMGDLSDIIGRKKVLLISMMGFVISFAFMGLGVTVGSIFWIFLGRGLSGLMAACQSVALAAIADLSSSGNKAVHMSFVAMVQTIGYVIGPFLGGLLSDDTILPFFNYALPFYFAAVLSLIVFFWIYWGFQETFTRKTDKKIRVFRIFEVFKEAWNHPRIRLLSTVFLAAQVGVGVYFQLILIYFQQAFGYKSFMMGLFNAFIGFWSFIALLVVIPFVSKRTSIERGAIYFLLALSVTEMLTAYFPGEISLWVVAVFFAMTDITAYTSMFTAYSNSTGPTTQGWAMGISGAVVALSFAFTGLLANFVPYLGVKMLIFLGSLATLGAGLLMIRYVNRYIKKA